MTAAPLDCATPPPTCCSGRRASAAHGPAGCCASAAATRWIPRPVPVWPTPTPAGLAEPWAASEYAGAVRAMVVGHKERGLLALRRPLGALLAAAVAAATVGLVGPGRAGARAVAAGGRARPRLRRHVRPRRRRGRAAAAPPGGRRRRTGCSPCGSRSATRPVSTPASGGPTSTGSMRCRGTPCAGSPGGCRRRTSSCATTCSPPAPPPARPSAPSRRWASRCVAIATVAATRRRHPTGFRGPECADSSLVHLSSEG